MKRRCPVCHRIIKAPLIQEAKAGKFFPFCSKRCKLIDLGAWLDAEYRMVSDLKSDNANNASDTASNGKNT